MNVAAAEVEYGFAGYIGFRAMPSYGCMRNVEYH